MKKYRVLLGVILEVEAESTEDAAEEAGKVSAGLGFSFSGKSGFRDNISIQTKLLNLEEIKEN